MLTIALNLTYEIGYCIELEGLGCDYVCKSTQESAMIQDLVCIYVYRSIEIDGGLEWC